MQRATTGSTSRCLCHGRVDLAKHRKKGLEKLQIESLFFLNTSSCKKYRQKLFLSKRWMFAALFKVAKFVLVKALFFATIAQSSPCPQCYNHTFGQLDEPYPSGLNATAQEQLDVNAAFLLRAPQLFLAGGALCSHVDCAAAAILEAFGACQHAACAPCYTAGCS